MAVRSGDVRQVCHRLLQRLALARRATYEFICMYEFIAVTDFVTMAYDNAAYCYDRVNHVIMSLVWLVLTNGNIPAIVATLICLQTMKFFQRMGFGESKKFFGGPFCFPYMMGLGQGNRATPPSWIQLSAVLVNFFYSSTSAL